MNTRKYWVAAALSILMVGWGANQFASLLALYRQEHGISELSVTAMLGIYVVGLVPALLKGGSLSDQRGRHGLTVFALVLTIVASVLMIIGSVWIPLIFVGRFVAGVATGLAMAATTSWVKELSQLPYDDAGLGSGARRASFFSAGGFWSGPVVAGLLAATVPFPQTVPYIVHIILSVVLLFIVRKVPETHHASTAAATPPATAEQVFRAQERFRKVVAPAAPWVFGAGTIGFAVVPAYMANFGVDRLIYSTVCVALTLGCGVFIQSVARKLDDPSSANAILVSLGTSAVGLGLLALAMALGNPWIGLLSSAVLGSGYGMMLVSGLLETQRLAPVGQLGSYNGKYYTLAYIGFLAPTILAFLGLWIGPWWQLGIIAVLLAASIILVSLNSRTALPLPSGANP